MELLKVDRRGRVTLTGHSDEMFVRHDNPDGSILLQPAVVKTAAQEEYDSSPQLRELLSDAASSPTVQRTYRRR